LPQGCVFGHKGPAIFLSDDKALVPLLGIGNSIVYFSLLRAQIAFGSYEVGVLLRTPIPSQLTDLAVSTIFDLYAAARSEKLHDEVEHSFLSPSLLRDRPFQSLEEAKSQFHNEASATT